MFMVFLMSLLLHSNDKLVYKNVGQIIRTVDFCDKKITVDICEKMEINAITGTDVSSTRF